MRIFLFPSESGPCSKKISQNIIDTLKDNGAVGELQISDHIFWDDFTTVGVPKSAFQGGSNCLIFL